MKIRVIRKIRETDDALLLQIVIANNRIVRWFAKSNCDYIDIEFHKTINVPDWIYRKILNEQLNKISLKEEEFETDLWR